MPIKAQFEDALVSIGGDFHAAKEWVKAFKGRRYDGATQTWHVPAVWVDVQPDCRYPVDVLSGPRGPEHITRYGTRHPAGHWEAQQETRKANERIAAAFRPRFAALERELRERLAATGLSDQAVAKCVEILRWRTLEEAEAEREIQFSSQQRRQALLAIQQWHVAAYESLFGEQAQAQADAERRIAENHGIY